MAKAEKTEQTDKPISKMEAVRRTIAKLGKGAKPLQIQAEVKSVFGIDMDTNVISAYKSTLKAVKKPATNGAKVAKPAAPKTEGGISVDDVRAIKEVTARIGFDNVKELVELLGK